MFLTKREREIIDLQNRQASRKIIASQCDVSVSQMHSTNSKVYKDFLEALRTVDENFRLFGRRMVRDNKEVKQRLLSINRKVSGGVKNR